MNGDFAKLLRSGGSSFRAFEPGMETDLRRKLLILTIWRTLTDDLGERDETRGRMLLRRGALCRRRRADAEGAMPLPRVPVHHRRLAEHVRSHAARRLRLRQGSAQAIQAPRPRGRRDAGILRRMRHASHHPAAGYAGRDFESRDARRTEPIRRYWKMAIFTIDKQAFHHIPGGHAEPSSACPIDKARIGRRGMNAALVPSIPWRPGACALRREHGASFCRSSAERRALKFEASLNPSACAISSWVMMVSRRYLIATCARNSSTSCRKDTP